MMNRFTSEGVPYASNHNDFNRSIWGVEISSYTDFKRANSRTIHEFARIGCEQEVGIDYTEDQRQEKENKLLQSAPLFKYP